MADTGIKPFLCNNIEKSLIRAEREKWLRSFELYLAAEEISNAEKKKIKLLHLGGSQLQEVAYNIPNAVVSSNSETNDDVFAVLVQKLSEYFSPKQNSTFERHVFRSLKPGVNENFNVFLLRLRQQASKCSFGNSLEEATSINIKDKLIDDWAPIELKKKILEKERSLEEIMELCQVHEQIGLQSKSMESSNSEPSSSVAINYNKVTYEDHNTKIKPQCSRCGKSRHQGKDCPAKRMKCLRCGFQGHFAIMCKTNKAGKRVGQRNMSESSYGKRQRPNRTGINFVEENTSEGDEAMGRFECFEISCGENVNDDIIECHIGGIPLKLLIDSGSKANIIKGEDYENLMSKQAAVWNIDLHTKHCLKSYGTDKPLKVEQRFDSTVRVPGRPEIISSFYVVNRGDISILGKEAAKRLGILKLGLNINHISQELKTFPKIKNIKVKLTIDFNVKPVKQPVRRVPVSVEKLVEQKLEEALQTDIIEKVTQPSSWISPIVIIFKPNNDIRICIDMRQANKAILRENYPLPTFDSFMTKLRNAKYFSRLDLTNAYHQIELHEDSRFITTFITHRGMFRYKRLLFGVNSAPEIFQRIFEGILSPCKNCLNYIDDIIVFGETELEHNQCLEKVINVLAENNVLLNESKCVTKVQEIWFLGHKLSHLGIESDTNKVKAIQNFREPNTKEETRSFLGLVTYLGKFIPDLATTTEPLRQLIKKDINFCWTPVHQHCFEKLKQELVSLPRLAYFDPTKRTQLIADASPVGLGAVLIQYNDEETPQVISFASKSLSSVERRYSQTEKESLALVWAVERFYYYLAGLTFELVTDHKPLEAIFKRTSRPPARIERWVLRLQSFKFKIVYKPGKENIADSLSRLSHANEVGKTFDTEVEHHIFTILENSSPEAINMSQIIIASRHDPEIVETITKLKDNSWKVTDKNVYRPFCSELTAIESVLLRGNKIVIPVTLRAIILELAHEGHPGETVMKRRLRAKVWWPLIDRETEKFVKNCRDCLLVSQPNRPPPMARHKFPDGPWQYLAIDLMGPLPNKDMILVLIDYFSRYQELKFLTTTTSAVVIEHLTEIFSRLGIPKSIRADNGRQFGSCEFKQFCQRNGIKLLHTPPYWPQANGEVENMNRSILKRLQIAHGKGTEYQSELRKFILMYNVTPHGTTGKSPSELMFGRRIRDKIPGIEDLMQMTADGEALDTDMLNKQKGKDREDTSRGAKPSTIEVGDKVLVQNATRANKLESRYRNEEFEVTQKHGNEVILSGEGKILRRHLTHLKKVPTLEEVTKQNVLTHELIDDISTNFKNPQRSQQPDGQQQAEEAEDGVCPKVPTLKLKRKEGLWEPA